MKTKNTISFMNLREELKREIIANIFCLKIYSKTITLIGGQSMVGKTVICLHLADECIKQNKKVLYLDTDNRPVSKRPEPNLLNTLLKRNPSKYKSNFLYSTEYDEQKIISSIKEIKPSLLIIDSIYIPYLEKCPKSPKQRAKEIRAFLMKLRDIIFEYNISVVLTSQIGKDTTNSDIVYNILGGEGLKHLSDTKWLIDFGIKDKGDIPDRNMNGRRFIFIDRQEQVELKIGYGGIIERIGVKNKNG